jgi:hypothetical protein
VNRALAAGWFHTAIEPEGWEPPFWHPLCADYLASDGWIRLHSNIPSHARAVVETLGIPEDADKEWARYGVTLNAAAAGHFPTDMTSAQFEDERLP